MKKIFFLAITLFLFVNLFAQSSEQKEKEALKLLDRVSFVDDSIHQEYYKIHPIMVTTTRQTYRNKSEFNKVEDSLDRVITKILNIKVAKASSR